MSQRMRRIVVLIGLGLFCTLAAPRGVLAQPVPPPVPALPGTTPQPAETNEFSHAITLPTNNKLQKKMEAAQDIINENIKNPKAETWGEVTKLLQSLLDEKEDVFIQVTRTDATGKGSV